MTPKLFVLSGIAVMIFGLPAFGESGRSNRSEFTLRYEGGGLDLRQNHAVKALLERGELVLAQGARRLSVPMSSVSEIECGSEVRQRFGSTLLGWVPFTDFEKAEDRYVSLGWTRENASGPKIQVLFKLNRSEYRDFITQLEKRTGRKAVDATKTPTVVRYSHNGLI